jgi:uncharacterized RmlC-like cupin family protein
VYGRARRDGVVRNRHRVELKAGELFYIPPVPHDSWVVGNEPYVSLHFLGAEAYSTAKTKTDGGR